MSIQPTSPSTGSAAIARLLPLPVGPDTTTGQWTPFAPAPLQGLHRYYEVLRPCAPHRYSGPCGFSRLDVSLGIGATGSHVPYKSLVRLRAAYMPDARGQPSGYPRACPGRWVRPRFRHHLIPYDTSSTVCFRSPLRTAPAGMVSRLLLQRSPPRLLAEAACSGLRPAPDCRPRGTCPHLSYSCAPPCGPATLVTHDPIGTYGGAATRGIGGATRSPKSSR